MDIDRELNGFEGTCRLFPLPEVVLFPHCILPLHIFEPRYRQMTEDALAGDRYLAMVKLKEGADWATETDPPIESVACLGKIFDYRRLADGRYNLLLVGLKRIRLIQELPKDRLYRAAHARLLDDIYPETPNPSLRTTLVARFRQLCIQDGRVEPEIARLLDKPIALGVLTDLLAHYLGLAESERQNFLNELRVEERVQYVTHALNARLWAFHSTHESRDLGFPPRFSMN